MLDRSNVARPTGASILDDLRRQGWEAFEAGAMPSASDEDWKYVELDFDLAALSLPETAGTPMDSMSGHVAAQVVDGFVDVVGTPTIGFSVRTFADVAAADPDLFDRGVSVAAGDIFLAASNAFSSDGVFVHVERNAVVETPIFIDIQSVSADTVSFPRVSVVVEENAEASVVLMFRSTDVTAVVAPIVESSLGASARLSMTSVQQWGRSTTGVGYQRVRLGRSAAMKMGEVGLGGALGRLDLAVDLEGDGSSYVLNGLSFGDGEQVLDYRMLLNHRGKNTSSDVLLKGAVEDEAESVFTGLLRIEEGATNTSAFENNRNLVLSEGAKAHSVPNLEILCDDVVCGHGSTVGPLEEDHLYYLASRGIGHERAQRVLVKGFFDEVIDKLPDQSVAGPVRDEVERKFVAAQQAGRLG